MRTLVDLDGVAADWGFGYNRFAETMNLYAHGGVRYEERPGWDLKAGLTKTGRELNDRIMALQGFYAELPLIEGAQSAIETLRNSGFDVWFVTTPFLSNPHCASEKLSWVEKHFGSSMKARTILTMDKTLIRGDVLIDDKPVIKGDDFPAWTHLCFGDYGYSNTTASQRVKNWDEALTEVTLLAWQKELTA